MSDFVPQQNLSCSRANWWITAAAFLVVVLVIWVARCNRPAALVQPQEAATPVNGPDVQEDISTEAPILSENLEAIFSVEAVSEADGWNFTVKVALAADAVQDGAEAGKNAADYGVFFFPGCHDSDDLIPDKAAVVVVPERGGKAYDWQKEGDVLAAIHAVEMRGDFGMKQGRFLVACGLDGVRFACRYAGLFHGCVLELSDKDDISAFRLLPLQNLAQIPVFLWTENGGRTSDAARFMKSTLAEKGGCVKLKEALFKAPSLTAENLSEGLQWCQQNFDVPRHVFWRADGLDNAEAWWCEIKAFEHYGQGAVIEAEVTSEPGSVPVHIDIACYNVASFALHCLDEPINALHSPVFLTINGEQRVVLPNVRSDDTGIEVVVKRDGNYWSMEKEKAQDDYEKTALCPGGMLSFLHHAFQIVLPTMNEDTAEIWRRSAEAFAAKWKEEKGIGLKCIKDSEYLAQPPEFREALLLGGPSENAVLANILSTRPSFLRNLFDMLPPNVGNRDKLVCAALCPLGEKEMNACAMVFFSDSVEDIPQALDWNVLFQARQRDFFFFDPDEKKFVLQGSLDHFWNLNHLNP